MHFRKKIFLLIAGGLVIVLGGILVWLAQTGRLSSSADLLRTKDKVMAYTKFSEYYLYEPVTFGLKNIGSTPVKMNSTPWKIQNVSTGQIIFTPYDLQKVIIINPGESKEWSWNQKDSTGTQVKPDNYKVVFEKFKVSADFSIVKQKIYSESFESDLGGWTADHFLMCETYNPPCQTQIWKIGRALTQAFDGKYSLESYLDAAAYDDGTIWMEKSFSVPANSSFQVNVNFYLWSRTQSVVNQWPVVSYVGLKDPEQESDFKIIGRTNYVAGWKAYNDSVVINSDSSGKIWVGFGFGATWEVARTYYLDLVNVSITPSGGGTINIQ
jgi:hypothetical protein